MAEGSGPTAKIFEGLVAPETVKTSLGMQDPMLGFALVPVLEM